MMTKTRVNMLQRAIAGLGCLPLLGALIASGCSDTDSGVCATYACVNEALLSGNASLGREATLVDVQLCVDDVCHEGPIDLSAPDGGAPCLNWDGLSHVCLTRSDDSGAITVDAVAEFAPNVTPHDASVRLVVTDHDTGGTLLDETRSTTHEITREDNCHRCWQAKATL